MITTIVKGSMDITKLLAGEGRSTSTITQYLSLLQRLHKRRGQHEGLLQRYHALFVEAIHDLAEERKTEQEVMKTAVGKAEIERMKKCLAKEIKEKLYPKGAGNLSDLEKGLLLQSLMLSLYSAIKPLHSDLCHVKVVRLGETRTDRLVDSIVETCINKFTFHRACKKQTGEETRFELVPRALNNQIADSLRLFPRKYVLSNSTGDEGMPSKALKRAFSTIFFKDGTVLDNSSLVRLFNSVSGA
ncbi:hypothetical protein KFL_001050230 [Klebsormidium nitens]|uniref:Uncharacterized protein n=1 Tax=Klebsormidium nitens TaxID=105231 RepID=A0A1Y1HUF3_KLENI|nr:hypothetical protein KFL_001050230 [Klebsormidium nitens]|eukprot:GAQ82260.1 hypothetical protein KFL_001050230 [Klebsormidium nitens]